MFFYRYKKTARNLSKSKKYVKNVVLTVVDIIGKEKIAKCQKIADDLNVVLRVRPFEE